MIRREQLKDVLHGPEIGRKEKILLCLAVGADTPKTPAALRVLATAGGLRLARDWNLSAILASLDGKAVRTPTGWELTAHGRSEVERLLGIKSPAHAAALTLLRAHTSKLSSTHVRAFVDEAISCAEAKLHRAAVVLLWVGALAVLYDHVVSQRLTAFNAEARRRDPRWRDAKTSDDLARMKEFDFLQILEAISVIGKSVKAELEICLKLRNGCGHPNSLRVAENRVATHIETLVLNVFSVYS